MIKVQLGYDNIDGVASLVKEYCEELGVDLSFQHFDEEIQNLASKYAMPRGRIYVAYADNKLAGCIALHPLSETCCEMKRFFVRKEYRNLHIGRILLQQLLKDAKAIGYETMVLDTLSTLESAVHLYYDNGFYEIPPYYDNPLEDVLYFEKIL